MSKTTQVHATIPEELELELIKMAGDDNRSFSQMVAILLRSAVNERNRKKKYSKAVYHSANSRKSNAGGSDILQDSKGTPTSFRTETIDEIRAIQSLQRGDSRYVQGPSIPIPESRMSYEVLYSLPEVVVKKKKKAVSRQTTSGKARH